MARWWKCWTTVAVVVFVLLAQASPAQAQWLRRLFGPPVDAPGPADNTEESQGPDFPNPSCKQPRSPFSYTNDEVPNAFEEWDDPRLVQADPYRFVFRAQYHRWQTKDANLAAPLVTSALAGGAGSFADADTQIELGVGRFSYEDTTGGRVTFGVAPGFFLPIEVSGFWLDDKRKLFSGKTDGTDLLARPVLALNLEQESVFVVGFPGVATGEIDVRTEMSFWGLDANVVCKLNETNVWMLDVLFGYRFAYFRETLVIENSLRSIDPNVAIPFGGIIDRFTTGFTSRVKDQFKSINEFNGGQVGFRNVFSWRRLNLMVDTKLAIGVTTLRTDIEGISTLNDSKSNSRIGGALAGGILALSSNSGTQEQTAGSVIPELNLTLGYQVNSNFRVFAGYDFIYWSRIIRPGDQLNNLIDTRQVPTDSAFSRTVSGSPALLPGRTFNTTDFWAHGYNFGIEISF